MRRLTRRMETAGVILTSYSYMGPLGIDTGKKFERSWMGVPSEPHPGRTGSSELVEEIESDWRALTRDDWDWVFNRASTVDGWSGAENMLATTTNALSMRSVDSHWDHGRA
jgi:hypothetical protein